MDTGSIFMGFLTQVSVKKGHLQHPCGLVAVYGVF